jgi:hypothetical protein
MVSKIVHNVYNTNPGMMEVRFNTSKFTFTGALDWADQAKDIAPLRGTQSQHTWELDWQIAFKAVPHISIQ